jgi:sugar-specific transcriptional regulator TrmB
LQQETAQRNKKDQEQTAARNKTELEYRIQKLDDFGKRLETEHNRLEETVRVADIREMDRIKTATELYKKAEEQYQLSVKQYELVNAYGESDIDQFHNMASLQATDALTCNRSIALLAHLQSKGPLYAPDEQALLATIVAIATVHNELSVISSRHSDGFYVTCKQLRADYERALQTTPQERQETLSKQYVAQVRAAGDRFRLQLAHDIAGPGEKLKQINAVQHDLLKKLDEADKKQGKR